MGVGTRQCAHDVRVKVCQALGDWVQFNNTVSVAVRPQPHLVRGQQTSLDIVALDAVYRWITLNEATINAYWDGAIGTVEMVRCLRRLP